MDAHSSAQKVDFSIFEHVYYFCKNYKLFLLHSATLQFIYRVSLNDVRRRARFYESFEYYLTLHQLACRQDVPNEGNFFYSMDEFSSCIGKPF